MNYIDRMVTVMQAFKEGKAIQRRHRNRSAIEENWRDAPEPRWDWFEFDYRVKPAEPRRVWLNLYPTMNCRSAICYDSREEAAKFAYYEVSQQIEFVEVME